MKLLEYQAKQILIKAGLPVPQGKIVTTADQVPFVLQELNLSKGVSKAQAYTGGRGKAGGVKLFKDTNEAISQTTEMLGMTLVTKQTGPQGTPVHSVYLEEASQIKTELYVAITIDRAKSSPVVMLCPEGGMDIEEIAEKTPEKILKQHPPLNQDFPQELANQGAQFLELPTSLYSSWHDCIQKLYQVFLKHDTSLLEINPLIVTNDDKLSILDCKFNIDENAYFRQQQIEGNPDAEKTESEIRATKYGLSYIQLDGNIGCMVNGAGLAMATMDIIQHYGGAPANFLDVGGSASEEAIAEAFHIITQDKSVKGILVNIFGGIMNCDKIARGIIVAMETANLQVPLVVRLSGTNYQEGRRIINESEVNLHSAETLSEAAAKIVKLI